MASRDISGRATGAWDMSRALSFVRPFLRQTGCVPVFSTSSRRWMATALAAEKSPSSAPPPPNTKEPITDAHINGIVDDISRLTLLQAADLVTALKARLNIQEVAAPVAAAPQVVTPTGLQTEEAPTEEKPKEKTIFTLTLESIEATAKPKIIREVKAMIPNLNLMDAKKFVESIPKVLKENVPKEEAEKLKATLEGLGAKVTLE